MKRFELTVTRGDIEIYKAVFSFTEEQEMDLFKKVTVLSEEGKIEGIDTSDVDRYVATNSDIIILAALRTQCLPLIEGIIAFENNIKKWGKQVVVITSNLEEIHWDCKRIEQGLVVVR